MRELIKPKCKWQIFLFGVLNFKKKGLQIRKSYLDKSQTLRENAMEKDLILF